MRSFCLTRTPHTDMSPPMPATMKLRGVCLMAIEFLTRYPAAECVVTCGGPEFWDCVMDLFPNTLFHAFQAKLEDPPRPNVIRHESAFCWVTATSFGKRATPYNVIFTGEDMLLQLETYRLACPAAALLWVTAPARDYVDGDLLYPLHCSQESCMCGLVPLPGQARMRDYSPYKAAVRWFQSEVRAPGSKYDSDTENAILFAYARSLGGLSDGPTAMLQVELARNSLPSAASPDTVFFWPDSLRLDEVPGFLYRPEYNPEESKEPKHEQGQAEGEVYQADGELSSHEITSQPQIDPKDLADLLKLAANYFQ